MSYVLSLNAPQVNDSVASFKPSTYICCYINQTILFVISVTMYDNVDYS